MAGNISSWDVVMKEINNENKVDSINGVGSNAPFKFKVLRQKEHETKRENLVIRTYYNNDEYGVIISSISNLHNDNAKLQDIGINLARQSFVELVKVINQHFYELPLEWIDCIGNGIPKEDLLKIVKHFKEYIKENDIEIKDDCYNIGVKEFTEEFENNMFNHGEKEVREALRLYKYTKCNGTSFTHVVKLDDKKSVKCISFWADKMDAIKEE